MKHLFIQPHLTLPFVAMLLQREAKHTCMNSPFGALTCYDIFVTFAMNHM